MSERLLVIDDDRRLFDLLSEYLEPHGFVSVHARDGREGLALLGQEPFDLVLLDVMLPGLGGLEVLRKLRERHRMPVVMLTARGDEADKVVGLELGADDYVAKPFGPRELLARLRAVLRRQRAESFGEERLSAADLVVEPERRSVRKGGARVELTGLELDLLVALLRRKGRVVPRQTLLEIAGRGDVTVSDRTIDVHISHLRRKLGDDPRTPRLLKTVRGVGYVLSDEEP